MFGVFYSGFSHCTASFPEVYDIFFVFCFFLVAFFGVTLFSLGDGGILENLIVMVAWCYIFKIDHRSGDKGGDRLGSAVFVDR
jgi:hypothetical protein